MADTKVSAIFLWQIGSKVFGSVFGSNGFSRHAWNGAAQGARD
jgi:hypothetical protein